MPYRVACSRLTACVIAVLIHWAQLQGAAAQTGTTTPLRSRFLPTGRGYDWSLAGYRDGAASLPRAAISFNVRRPPYNAKGDGVSDDTAAIKRAIDAANASPTGGVVYFPGGTYVLRDRIEIKQTNVVLRGAGMEKTKIYIPVSLSDVFQNTWTMDPNGEVTTSWSFGGAFIEFDGKPQSSGNANTLLTTVRPPVALYARRLPVVSRTNIQVGDWVRVFINDASTGVPDPVRKLQQAAPQDAGAAAVAAAAAATPGKYKVGNVTLITQEPPAWVKRSAAYRAAMSGRRWLREEGESGLTVAQALEAERVWAARRAQAGGGTDAAGANAAAGTIAAWIYRENMADSGDPGTVQKDEVSVIAKVAAVGGSAAKPWIDLDRDMPFPVKAGWRAAVHRESPSMQNCGVEKLTIEFKHDLIIDHFTDRGFNAMQFSYATNSFVQQVKVVNADNALFFEVVDKSTVTDVVMDVTAPRWDPALPGSRTTQRKENGHHMISVGEGSSNLIQRFNIAAKFIHDLTTASGASMNVFHSGGGFDLNIDTHRSGSFGNLFAQINTGLGTRPFDSGGKNTRGAHAGRSTTYWNINASGKATLPLPECSTDFGAGLNFVGSYSGDKCGNLGWYVQTPFPAGTPNVFVAQRAARREQALRNPAPVRRAARRAAE